jgi:hypothetical protein
MIFGKTKDIYLFHRGLERCKRFDAAYKIRFVVEHEAPGQTGLPGPAQNHVIFAAGGFGYFATLVLHSSTAFTVARPPTRTFRRCCTPRAGQRRC